MGNGNIIVPQYVRATAAGRLLQTNSSYDDIVQPVTALRGGVAAPTSADWLGGLYRQKFTVDDEVHGEIQNPHSYKPGSSIYFHVHFALDDSAGAVATDAVNWELTYSKCNGYSGAIAAPGAALTKETTVGESVAYSQFHADFTAIDMTGYAESSIIIVKLKRIAVAGVGATEYGDHVALLGFDAHIEMNKLGTAQTTRPYTP